MQYILAFLLICFSAQAQTITSLSTYVSSQLPNNTQRQITPANVRNAVLAFPNNMFVSSSYPVTTSSYVSANTFYGDGSHLTGIMAGATTPSTPFGGVQFNSGGLFDASANFVFSSATNVVSVTGVSTSVLNALTSSITNLTVGTITPTVYGMNTTVASNTQVLYVSGTRMDGALGISYDRIQNFTFFGTPTGVVPPTPSATIHVSGTILASGNISGSTGNIGALTVGSCIGCAGAATPGGPSGSIQFNLNGASISGSSNFTTVNNNLGLGISVPNAKLDVNGTISSTGLSVSGGITGTALGGTLISATAATGTVTATNIYGKNISGSTLTVGSCVGCVTTPQVRAWLKFTGIPTTCTIVSSSGISACNYRSTAQYDISLTTPAPDANYNIQCTAIGRSANSVDLEVYHTTSPTTAGFVAWGFNTANNAATDISGYCTVIY